MTFQKGVSGNPNGRPKSKEWSDALRNAVRAIPSDDPEKRQRLELLAEALMAKALSGDVMALKEIGDRIEGKVPQSLVGADGESPAELVITWLSQPPAAK